MCIGTSDWRDRGFVVVIVEMRLVETKHRSGWMTAMITLSVLVAAVFVLFLIMTLTGILD
jgi:hypothetical protein